jgi:outer membrane protein assembly factor BamD (BamD/ComL family)
MEPSRSRVDAKEEEPNRTWDPREWEEDQRYVEALDLLVSGYKRDALTKLKSLYNDDPGHLYGRAQLLSLAVEVGEHETVREHAEWAVGFYVKQTRPQDACDTYRAVREALPDLEWSERPLVQTLVSAEKVSERKVVLDVTRQLIVRYPKSPALPKALYLSAGAQLEEGRPDLAVKTFQNLIDRFPIDPLADMAQRKLRELATKT